MVVLERWLWVVVGVYELVVLCLPGCARDCAADTEFGLQNCRSGLGVG